MLMNERVWKDFISFFAVKVTPFAMSILSLYFLASSSPNKGDVFGSEVFVCINPFALRELPLYFAAQNTGGEGEVYIPFSSAVSRSITRYFCFLYRRYLKLLLCVAPAIGEVSRREGGGENDISSVCLFSSPVVSHNGIGGVSDGREG